MAIQCANCASQNPDQSAFCVRCGQTLSAQNPSPNYGYTPPVQFAASAFSAPPSQPIGSQGGAMPPPFPTPGSSSMGQQGAASSAVVPIGGAQGNVSLRRAFAGHGTPVMHYSWLLDGKQVQAATLTTVIVQRLLQRGVAGLGITQEKLMERGILVETRDYIKVFRGVSTVFVYVAPAGHDLYISRATLVRPAINNVRVAIFLLLAFIALFGPSLIGGIVGNIVASSAASASPGTSLLGSAIYTSAVSSLISSVISVFVSPLYLFFFVILVRAIINWIFEKDFWMFLRSNFLNDFQLDDIALMEHVTDEIIHDAVDELGLDASKIAPPQAGYQPKRRIRAF